MEIVKKGPSSITPECAREILAASEHAPGTCGECDALRTVIAQAEEIERLRRVIEVAREHLAIDSNHTHNAIDTQRD
jgi:hypothetical protein